MYTLLLMERSLWQRAIIHLTKSKHTADQGNGYDYNMREWGKEMSNVSCSSHSFVVREALFLSVCVRVRVLYFLCCSCTCCKNSIHITLQCKPGNIDGNVCVCLNAHACVSMGSGKCPLLHTCNTTPERNNLNEVKLTAVDSLNSRLLFCPRCRTMVTWPNAFPHGYQSLLFFLNVYITQVYNE